MKTLKWEELRPIRESRGMTLEQMAKACGFEEIGFLRRLEDGELKKTSSAVMACVAKGYKIELERCAGLVAHWSEHWPKEKFGVKKEIRRRRKRKGRLAFRTDAITAEMEKRGMTTRALSRAAGLYNETIRRMLGGEMRSISAEQAEKIGKALGLEESKIIVQEGKP